MARKYKLTWRATDKRWQKFYRGKRYYFAYGKGKTDQEGYKQALAEWERLKAEIDEKEPQGEPDRKHEPAYERIINRWRGAVAECTAKAEDDSDCLHDLRICSAILSHLQATVDKRGRSLPNPAEFDFDYWDDPRCTGFGFLNHPEFQAVLERFAGSADAPPPTEKTVGGNVIAFLRSKREQAERGDISCGRYDVIRCGLEDFQRFARADKLLSTVNGLTVAEYHAKVSGSGISAYTARDRMQAVKQFLHWCYEVGTLDSLPRNLANKSRNLTVKTPTRKIRLLSGDFVASILAGSTGTKTQLYVLLMLNCGMYPVDISDLKVSEVDLRSGRITRKRSKTKDHEDVPTVDYLLWKPTLDLLRQFRSESGDRVLLNEKGMPLRSETIVNGKVKRTDNIKSAYARLCRKLGLPCEPLKRFRKTAASKLETHEEYGQYVPHFLGHAPATVADKSYRVPSGERFDRAVKWLGEQFLPQHFPCQSVKIVEP